MRAAPLLLLIALLPLAAARPDLPDLDRGQVTVGPCVAGWSVYWPGETLGARCDAAGQTVAASYGTCALGHYVYARAGPLTFSQPCDLRWDFSELIA